MAVIGPKSNFIPVEAYAGTKRKVQKKEKKNGETGENPNDEKIYARRTST